MTVCLQGAFGRGRNCGGDGDAEGMKQLEDWGMRDWAIGGNGGVGQRGAMGSLEVRKIGGMGCWGC